MCLSLLGHHNPVAFINMLFIPSAMIVQYLSLERQTEELKLF